MRPVMRPVTRTVMQPVIGVGVIRYLHNHFTLSFSEIIIHLVNIFPFRHFLAPYHVNLPYPEISQVRGRKVDFFLLYQFTGVWGIFTVVEYF